MNAWTEADAVAVMRKEGELLVHKKQDHHVGLRNIIHGMQQKGLVKEVYSDKFYRYYSITKKGSQSFPVKR